MGVINQNRFDGFCDLYDSVRPNPPDKICTLILSLLNTKHIDRVVDIGCGTGLSLNIWGKYCNNMIGIDPNREMIEKARVNVPNATFFESDSCNTGLNPESIDIATCSQSFHWMEPVCTLKEVFRFLKPGGIFAAYSCLWPVTLNISAELEYEYFYSQASKLYYSNIDNFPKERKWPQSEQIEAIKSNNNIRYFKQVFIDNSEPCDAKRFSGIAVSQSHIQMLIKYDIEGIHDLIANFEAKVGSMIPSNSYMHTSYILMICVKK